MNEYPLVKFSFQVDWGGTQIGFQEVSGLDIETEVIEYRQGASPDFTKIKESRKLQLTDF
jgi:phage tail-like protein